MGFYDDMAQDAADLIDEFGFAVSIQRGTGGTFDPVTGLYSGVSESDLETKGIRINYKSSLIDGVRIKHGDKLYVLNSSLSPLMTDKVLVGSEYWSIVKIDTKSPAGVDIVHFVQVRK